jgi:hypothetical protein
MKNLWVLSSPHVRKNMATKSMKTLTLFSGSESMDCLYFHEDPISNTDSESPRAKYSDFVSLREPKIMEICEDSSMVDEQPYFLIDRADLVQYRGHFHGHKKSYIFQPLVSAALALLLEMVTTKPLVV